MRVIINDMDEELPDGSCAGDLIARFGSGDGRGLAIAIGDAVLPRSRWGERVLEAGERITLIRATQGG
jgi:sulfur carrier protein